MDCTLVQSTKIGAAYGKSHNSKQRGGSGVANVRMISNTSVGMQGGLRISSPSLSVGRGPFNAVDKFHSKVAIYAPPRGRGSRCVDDAGDTFDRFPDEPILTGHGRFTDKGFEVVELAHEEARQMGHNYVGTEHILLAIIAQGTGIAAKVLKSMGIGLKDARVEVEKIIGKGNVPVEEIPTIMRVLERTPRVSEYTIDEAHKLGRHYIFSEHWLLGILREDQCVAVRVLKNLGADPNNIRTRVIQMIGQSNKEAV